MKNVWVERQKLPFGDYAICSQCGEYWNINYVFNIYDHQFIMCPECFEKFKKEVNKL